MSQVKSVLQVLSCFFLLSFISYSQSGAIEPDQNSVGECRVSKFMHSGPDGTSETTYEVDSQSRLVKEFNNSKSKDTGENHTSTVTYNYDAEGFLTQRAANYTYPKASKYNFTSNTEKFTYAAGKLSKKETTTTFGDASLNEKNTQQYEYDAGGDLMKITTTRLSGGVEISTYSKGKLTGISGSANTYVINDKGFVTKLTDSAGDYTIYTYDADDRQTKAIGYNKKGEKTREDKNEHSTTSYRIPTNPIALKGHPTLSYLFGNLNFPVTKYTVAYYKASGTDSYQTVYSYEIDSNGNLKTITEVSDYGTETTKYSYTGCK